MTPSTFFKQRQKSHALIALRSVPKPIPGLEHIHFAAQVLPIAQMQPVAEAAPDGGMIVPDEAEISVTLEGGRAGSLRYVIQGLVIPNMPLPIKLHSA